MQLIKDKKIPMCFGGESLTEVRIEKGFVTLISSCLTEVSDGEENKKVLLKVFMYAGSQLKSR